MLQVRHNIEVAHRLVETKGKCEAIHGHSMWVTLQLLVNQRVRHDGMYVNDDGLALEFGAIKKRFRGYLDAAFDHHLLLNRSDPFAGPLYMHGEDWENGKSVTLPGLMIFEGDPTTENLAEWIAEACVGMFKTDARVLVEETAVNAAAYQAVHLV